MQTQYDYAVLFSKDGQLEEATRFFAQCADLREKVLGARHRDTLKTYGYLAHTYNQSMRFGEAEELFLRTSRIQRDLFGEKDVDALVSEVGLAISYHRLEKSDMAAKVYYRVIASYETFLEPDDPKLLVAKHGLAQSLLKLGRLTEAEDYFAEVAMKRRIRLGAGHPYTLASLVNRAKSLELQKKYARAGDILVDVRAQQQVTGLALSGDNMLDTAIRLARVLNRLGDLQGAIDLLQESVDHCREQDDLTRNKVRRAMTNLGGYLIKDQQFSRAVVVLEEVVEFQLKAHVVNHRFTWIARLNLVEVYADSSQTIEALNLGEYIWECVPHNRKDDMARILLKIHVTRGDMDEAEKYRNFLAR